MQFPPSAWLSRTLCDQKADSDPGVMRVRLLRAWEEVHAGKALQRTAVLLPSLAFLPPITALSGS